MASPGDAFLIAALTVGIAGAIGYGIFRWVSPKGRPETPTQMGRKWFAWLALITTVTFLPKFIRTFDVDAFAIWILNFVVWGGLAFVGGWLYGKLSGLKGSMPAAPSSAPTRPSAFSQPAEQSATHYESASTSARARLEQLNELHRKGLVTEAEYDQQRARILSEL